MEARDMTTDPIAAARALIEPLTGYTPGPWRELDESECYSHDDGNTVSVAIGKRDNHAFALAMHNFSDRIVDANAALIAAGPDLRDMVATLADALEAERLKAKSERLVLKALKEKAEIERDALVAAAYEAAATEADQVVAIWEAVMAIRSLTPADAQAALDKLLTEARLEGWRAGRDEAAELAKKYAAECLNQAEDSRYNEQFETASYFENREGVAEYIAHTIRAMPEPKEASHD